MAKARSLGSYVFVLGFGALIAATANYACLPDVCADLKTASFTTSESLEAQRILSLHEALANDGMSLSSSQQQELKLRGHLLGLLTLKRPVRHPDGTVEMPADHLPPLPEGHPWAQPLSPSDDAFYSFFEERILRPKLYDPENPQHATWAQAYLKKARSQDPDFIGWTYANRTECSKIRYDAKGTMAPTDARF